MPTGGDEEKVPQTLEELRTHLKETIYFIESSVKSFDCGFEQEAKRLAASIRVLVHDTKYSHSILKQLNQKSIPFYDSASPELEGFSPVYHGLIGMFLGTSKRKIVPHLDVDAPKLVDFDTWWNGCVIRDNQGHNFTRKELVLAVANQDGGSHVDPALDKQYSMLSRQNTLGWVSRTSEGHWEQLKGPEKATVRQIAHEILKTLKPGYKMSSSDIEGSNGLVIGGMALHITSPEDNKTAKKVGRNEPCPCKSGKKYKKCCGA